MQKPACLTFTLLVLILFAPAAPGSELTGQFFYTLEEREALDRLRNAGEGAHRVQQKEFPSTPGVSAADPAVTLRGVVVRSSGKGTIWLNDRSYNENDLPPGIRVPSWSERGDMTVKVKKRGGSLTLKPGQTVGIHDTKQGLEKR